MALADIPPSFGTPRAGQEASGMCWPILLSSYESCRRDFFDRRKTEPTTLDWKLDSLLLLCN